MWCMVSSVAPQNHFVHNKLSFTNCTLSEQNVLCGSKITFVYPRGTNVKINSITFSKSLMSSSSIGLRLDSFFKRGNECP